MKSVHLTLSGAIALLSFIYCQTIDEYVDVDCEYQRGGAVCNCQYSSEVNFSYQFMDFCVKSMRYARMRILLCTFLCI